MFNISVNTQEELKVIEQALKEYKSRLKHFEKIEDFLKDKNFRLGDYVIKNEVKHFDNVFGVGNGDVGKIVGWDFENNYYRVYFNKNQPFQGVRESQLKIYNGGVSSELYLIEPKEITRLVVDLL